MLHNDIPFFSIIIPTYNRAHLIVSTIQSVLSQRFCDFEIIIVDDGSTDNTEDVVKPFLNEGFFYYKKKNQERAVARNYGTVRAKGQYINWFDSDDIMLPHHLEIAKKFIDEKNNPEAVATLYQILTETGELVYKESYSGPTLNNRLIYNNCIACNPVFLRKDIALKFPFNESLVQVEDYELWLRIAANFPFYHINTLTVNMINHSQRSQNVVRKQGKKNMGILKNFIVTVKNNKSLSSFIGRKMNYFVATKYLITANSFAASGMRARSFVLVFKSFFIHPQVIFIKLFYSSIKKTILG